jgi:large subunit ribosomal protein L29
MKISDVRKMDKDALASKLTELKEEEFNFKIQISTQQLANFKQYYATKRDIARVKTVLTELDMNKPVGKK